MIYACPFCNWSLPEPDPSDYPDTEQGQDSLAADYPFIDGNNLHLTFVGLGVQLMYDKLMGVQIIPMISIAFCINLSADSITALAPDCENSAS